MFHNNKLYEPRLNAVFRVFTYCLLFIFFLGVIFVNEASAAEEFAIFTTNSDFRPLSKNKVRMLYRGKVKLLQGKKVELSDWSEDSEFRRNFYQQLLGKDTAQMNAYWARLSFSGKARPPKVIKKDSVNELLEWVEKKKLRIGYAKLDTLPDTVNILYVVKKEKQ